MLRELPVATGVQTVTGMLAAEKVGPQGPMVKEPLEKVREAWR